MSELRYKPQQVITIEGVGRYMVIGACQDVGTEYYQLSSTAPENSGEFDNALLMIKGGVGSLIDVDEDRDSGLIMMDPHQQIEVVDPRK